MDTHLQAKVESLAALNAYLKEQVDVKERAVQEAEERLRRQEEDVRSAFAEVDAQNRKLKKREQLISQALKRLEVPFPMLTRRRSTRSRAAPPPPLLASRTSMRSFNQ